MANEPKSGGAWKAVAPVIAVLFTFFGLCFGMISWYVQTRTQLLKDTLEQRRLLAEDRERAAADREAQARQVILQLQDSVDSLQLSLKAQQERETAFQSRIADIQRKLTLGEAERKRLSALVTESKDSEASAAQEARKLRDDVLWRATYEDPVEVRKRIMERWPSAPPPP